MFSYEIECEGAALPKSGSFYGNCVITKINNALINDFFIYPMFTIDLQKEIILYII